jgi:hypothetical protein
MVQSMNYQSVMLISLATLFIFLLGSAVVVLMTHEYFDLTDIGNWSCGISNTILRSVSNIPAKAC